MHLHIITLDPMLVKSHAGAYTLIVAIGQNSPAFQIWVRLVRSHRRIADAVDAAFKAASLPTLEWYDVLLELERHRRPLRARELEQRLLLAQYNLSRLLDRLESRGLIVRKQDPADGRSRLIQATETGIATRKQMWPVYRRTIEAMIGQKLSTAEAEQLGGLLAPIASADDRKDRA